MKHLKTTLKFAVTVAALLTVATGIMACTGQNGCGILATVKEAGEKTGFRVGFTTAGNCYILRLVGSRATPFRVRRLVLLLTGL